MTRNDAPFTSDEIDDHIECVSHQQDGVSASDLQPANARLIHHLYALHQLDPAVTHSLERVRQRLEQARSRSAARVSDEAVPGERDLFVPARLARPQHRPRFLQARAPLATLVAVLILVALVSGVSLGLVLVHHPDGGAGSVTPHAPSSTAAAPTQVVTLDSSWAKLYHSLKDLKHDADLVVQGSVSQVLDTQAPSQTTPYPMTDFLFTVTRVLHDPAHRLLGSLLTLHQTGGVIGRTLYQVGDDPLFRTGEQDILFLHEYQSGFYFVLGGPSGRFLVEHGQVRPINDEGVAYSGPLSDFIAQVENA
jgi:hypothetical protein